MKPSIAVVVAIALAAGCSSSSSSKTAEPGRGSAVVRMDGLTDLGDVTRLHLDVQPANHQFDFVPVNGQVLTVVQVVPGTQTFTVTAFTGSPGDETLVGEGSAVGIVTGGQTVNVVIKVLDTTGPEPTPDMGPVITSLVTPSAVDAGATATFSATAVDPDGDDQLSYEWTQQCNDGEGSFASPSESETSWTAPATGGWCTIVLTATAGTLTDEREALVEVRLGSVDLILDFVQQPVIESVWVDFANGNSCEIYRDDENATCPGAQIPGGTAWVSFEYQLGTTGDYSVELTDTCGGSATEDVESTVDTSASFEWIAPTSPDACVLTARVTNDGLTDEFPFAVVFAGCAEDDAEDNDTSATASDAGVFAGSEMSPVFNANDDDYYAFQVADGVTTITFSIAPVLQFEMLDSNDVVLAASDDQGVLSAPVTAGTPYVLHVVAPNEAGTCGPTYQVAIDAPIAPN